MSSPALHFVSCAQKSLFSASVGGFYKKEWKTFEGVSREKEKRRKNEKRKKRGERKKKGKESETITYFFPLCNVGPRKSKKKSVKICKKISKNFKGGGERFFREAIIYTPVAKKGNVLFRLQKEDSFAQFVLS